MKKYLESLIGKQIMNSGITNDELVKLVACTNYLHTQLNVVRNDSDADTKEYIDSVLDKAEDILK